jgi:hypothetical protein
LGRGSLLSAPASLIQKATASRVDSVISNCTGREVFCCMTIARAATRSPWELNSALPAMASLVGIDPKRSVGKAAPLAFVARSGLAQKSRYATPLAFAHAPRLLTHGEHMFSGGPPIAAGKRAWRHSRSAPRAAVGRRVLISNAFYPYRSEHCRPRTGVILLLFHSECICGLDYSWT